MKTRTLLALSGLALAASVAASGGENLSAEALLPVHEGKDCYRPGAGFGKDVFLVVWQADRLQKGDLVACRLDKSGKPLDAKPFVVSAAKDDQERPRIAFGKDVFLVVWQDLRNEKDYDTYAARISPEGKVLDPDGILVAGGPGNQSRPRAAFDGKTFVIVWEDMRNGKSYEVYAARVSPEGKVLDAGGVALPAYAAKTPPPIDRQMPAVASLGDGKSLVLWCGSGWQGPPGGLAIFSDGKFEDKGTVTAAVGGDGGYTNGFGSKGRWSHSPVSAVAGKDNFLLTWRNQRVVGRGGSRPNSFAMLVDRDGKTDGKILTLTGAPHIAMDPDAAWDGSAFVAAWGDQPQTPRPNYDSPKGQFFYETVAAVRAGPDGKPLGAALSVSGTFDSPANRAAVASDGAGTSLIAYEKHPATGDVPIKIGVRILTAK